MKNENGFTLLEVLVAGVIGIVVAFGVAKAAINATQSERASELDLAFVTMMTRLQNAIDDPALCPTIFRTWNTGTSTFDPPAFNPAAAPVTIDQIVDGSPTNVALTPGPAGGPTVGLTVPSMTFSEPSQVSDNTYEWTLTITTTKVAPTGGTFLGNPTALRRFRIEVTSSGAPGYTSTYCGPPVSPEANQQVPLLKFTSDAASANSFCDSSDATKDSTCAAEFTSAYSAATLGDLFAFRMLFYHNNAGDAINPSGLYFAVAGLVNPHNYTNSIDTSATPVRPAGTVVDIKQSDPGEHCHIPCIRNTAPLRFVRGFWDGAADKNVLCRNNIGVNYVNATLNDLVRFGYRIENGAVAATAMHPSSPGGTFDGFACKIGWSTTAPAGPAIDCAAGGSYPVACVLR